MGDQRKSEIRNRSEIRSEILSYELDQNSMRGTEISKTYDSIKYSFVCKYFAETNFLFLRDNTISEVVGPI